MATKDFFDRHTRTVVQSIKNVKDRVSPSISDVGLQIATVAKYNVSYGKNSLRCIVLRRRGFPIGSGMTVHDGRRFISYYLFLISNSSFSSDTPSAAQHSNKDSAPYSWP